jgi:hypothetical protein
MQAEMTIDLERKKYRLIRAIIGDTDNIRVLTIEKLYNLEPCTFTMEEMRTSVIQRKNNFETGKNNLIPHDSIKKLSVL